MQTIEDPLLKERLVHETLPGGLRAYVLPKPGYATRFACLTTRYGSVDQVFRRPGGAEVTVPAGIAHFLEHKLFEEEDGNVADRFAAIGASANAYTNHTATTYLFSATERYEDALRLLLRFTQHPYFTPESVAKEQGIIEQELRMYEDDPRSAVFRGLLEALYVEHPVRIDIGGTVESIHRITADDLLTCYRTFYHPSNMVFFTTGDLEPEAVFAILREEFAAKDEAPAIERPRPGEPAHVRAQIARRKMAVAVPLLELGFKDSPPGGDALRREIATELALEVLLGASSTLRLQLYEEGLIGDRFAADYFAGADFASVVMGGPTPEPDRLLERLREGLRRATSRGLEEAAIERARRRAIGEFVSLFDAPEAVAHAFTEYAVRGMDVFDFLPQIAKVDSAEVAGRAEIFLKDENWSASIVEPQEARS